MRARCARLVHDVIARPLQIAIPPLGDWLYDLTAPSRRHPTVVGVRYALMFEPDPAGGWRIRNSPAGRLTGPNATPTGERVPARPRGASTPVTPTHDGEGARRPAATVESYLPIPSLVLSSDPLLVFGPLREELDR